MGQAGAGRWNGPEERPWPGPGPCGETAREGRIRDYPNSKPCPCQPRAPALGQVPSSLNLRLLLGPDGTVIALLPSLASLRKHTARRSFLLPGPRRPPRYVRVHFQAAMGGLERDTCLVCSWGNRQKAFLCLPVGEETPSAARRDPQSTDHHFRRPLWKGAREETRAEGTLPAAPRRAQDNAPPEEEARPGVTQPEPPNSSVVSFHFPWGARQDPSFSCPRFPARRGVDTLVPPGCCEPARQRGEGETSRVESRLADLGQVGQQPKTQSPQL